MLLLQCMSRFLALNVTCCDATIPSLSGDKRTHRDHWQSVARDPEPTWAGLKSRSAAVEEATQDARQLGRGSCDRWPTFLQRWDRGEREMPRHPSSIGRRAARGAGRPAGGAIPDRPVRLPTV